MTSLEQVSEAMFRSDPENPVNTKNVTSNISTHAWSTKSSLFTKLFVWMGCKAPFGRASALPKTAPALAPQMERLFWWSWSRFRKCLAKQLHLLD